MLDYTILLGIRTIVTHEACADGVASALILKDALPGARVVFAQHNTPALRDMKAEPGMLFCDMVPPSNRAAEFVAAGACVLDHHRGARDVVAAFGERGIFADESEEPGTSGAVLAYREVWRRRYPDAPIAAHVALFAEHAGVRDTWQRLDPKWQAACAQAAALRFWPWPTLADAGSWSRIDEMLRIGDVLLAKDAERDARLIAEAHRFTIEGVRIMAFESLSTSDVADRVENEIDLVLGWHYMCRQGRTSLCVSCRSRNGFSSLDFAKRHGGGGHVQAAGFQIDVSHDDPPPHEMLRRLLLAHVAPCAA